MKKIRLVLLVTSILILATTVTQAQSVDELNSICAEKVKLPTQKNTKLT